MCRRSGGFPVRDSSTNVSGSAVSPSTEGQRIGPSKADFMNSGSVATRSSVRPATIAVAAGRYNNALVPLRGLLLRGRIPREQPAPSRQWDLGACVPEPLRIPTRRRLVLLDDQCPLGPLQPCRRLPARLSCRQLQSAQDPARALARGGHPDLVANACPRIRTVPRRPVTAQKWGS